MIVLVATAPGRIPPSALTRLERRLACQSHLLNSMVHPFLNEVPVHPLAVGVECLLGLSRLLVLLLLLRLALQLAHRQGNLGRVLSALEHILRAARLILPRLILPRLILLRLILPRLILPLSQRPKEHGNSMSLLKANMSNSAVHRKNWRPKDNSGLQVDRFRERNCNGSLNIMRGYGLD